MESWGAKDEDVYMHALGASLNGDAKLWFDHLESGSITGYDMFTDQLIEEWGVDIKQSIEEQLDDDCVNEDQFDEDDQKTMMKCLMIVLLDLIYPLLSQQWICL